MPKTPRNRPDAPFMAVSRKALDPTLASLFATSSGPVQPPPKSRYAHLAPKAAASKSLSRDDEADEDDEELSSLESGDDDSHSDEGGDDDPDDDASASEQPESDDDAALAKVQESAMSGLQDRPSKKRKRGNKEEELEDVYMQKIAREEAKEDAIAEEKRQKKRKTKVAELGDGDAASQSGDSDAEAFTIPKHETLTESKASEDEIEKATRTVFLSNVSSEAITSKSAKKTLLQHLASFLSDLPDHKSQHPHKVESLRFRSTAFSSSLPKKAAFAKKEVMDATTKSTNAYAVYSTKDAAREATRTLNGTIVLGRHLRVDSVTHPAKVDHRRCVFVGNLGFVDDESALDASEGKKASNRPPSDVEEGLWVQFSKAGKVENVRVIRDSKTRVGKGIAYVQFEDENGVEAALQFNDQRYPPLLPRKLRVSRAKQQKRNAQPPPSYLSKIQAPVSKSKGGYIPKVSEEQKSKLGRARAVLSKAGQYKTAESFVFEGHRASKGNSSGLKLKGKKKAGKPKGRSSKRGTAWKASGGKRKTD
ncbi:hypothetical protein K505DRAFT_310599 [Melanomma pulvis-pyrius CBS 109.77]|uniref:Nucleolar protein 12 n=1 Tax=Melanomma pulvis-pyrius CBS 109.77 TaxID=1314802 RepID=A0A6A6X3H2_9PLEO|nr:hypothetical protein K505DRAFT_310599 [Melanomma pulvis-pyrius CBS 109.77]